VAPKTLAAAQHVVPGPQRRQAGGEDRRHAGTGRQAVLAAFERGQPLLEHAHGGVGEARVDEASSSPANRAAACAALSKTKLDVRNSASLCSLNSLRSVPARTARVSKSGCSRLMTQKPARRGRAGFDGRSL